MGLFDHIKCKYPLPEGYERWQEAMFQTKDLGSTMVTYIITPEGRLTKNRRYYESHPTQTRWSGLLGKEVPVQVVAHEAQIDQDWHGDIVFYEYDQGSESLIEFRARFTEGTLQWIRPQV